MERYDDEFDWTQRARAHVGRQEKASRFSQRCLCFAIFFLGFCAGLLVCAALHEVMK